MRALPRGDVGEELRHGLAVADEVVVDEEERSARAEADERVELGEHLRGRLHPRCTPEDLDDVAELAVEGAAARDLDRVARIPVELAQLETRHASERQHGLRVAGRGQHPLLHLARPLEGAHEEVEPALGLADEDMGRLGEEVGRGGGRRAAHHGGLPERAGAVEHLAHRVGLHEHPRDEDRVRAAQDLVGERPEVQIVELELPGGGEVGGERREAERRKRRVLAEVGETVVVAPVRRRRRSLHEQRTHLVRGREGTSSTRHGRGGAFGVPLGRSGGARLRRGRGRRSERASRVGRGARERLR